MYAAGRIWLIVLNVFAFVLCSSVVDSANILGLFGHYGKSHFDVFKPLLVDLAKRGHNVSVLGYFPLEEQLPGYTDLLLKNPVAAGTDLFDLNLFENPLMVKYLGANIIHSFGLTSCEHALSSKTYQDLLNSNQHFDLIISELFNTNCLLIPTATKFGAPFVGITSHVLMPWHETWLGHLSNPSFAPVIFLGHGDSMSFLERVENFLMWLYSNLYYRYSIERDELELVKKYVGNGFPSTSQLMKNTSLILSNSQFSMNRPRPLVPNLIEVGGIHIGKAKKLKPNIEKWINESTHGVIYFSLGSMIKGHTFPEEKRQMFLKAFARLPQRVLWKWEKEMPGKPDNVMIQKWMPQFDILNHPNVKAFISHGGLLGTTEAVHCGVPMVIMPQYGDQFANARAVEISGGGVMLDFTTITEDIIYDALKKVLSSEFNTKAKDLSERFRDRPLPPLETAVYWVEYVARHKGAPHMRTAAVGMPLYQYLLLDVIAFLLVVFIVIIYSLYFVLKRLLRLFIKPKSKQKLKSN